MSQKKLRKITATSIAATAALAAVAPAAVAAAEDFNDLKPGESHYDAVQALVEQGVFKGYPDGSFKPYQELSRQHAAVAFAAALDLQAEDVEGTLAAFTDVDASSPYAEQIAAVVEAGIFVGNNGEFNPNDTLTRQNMAVTLVNAFGLENTGEAVNVNLDGVYYKDAVTVLAQNGVTTVTDFRPNDAVTRGAFSTFVYSAQAAVEAQTPAVESVSAIDRNGVTVTFPATEEAQEDFSIEVIDNNGDVVAVDSVDLVKGETIATFYFKSPLGEDPEGTWTVGGLEIDLDFLALLDDVNTASTQVDLYNALKAVGAENLVVSNADEYFAEFGTLTDDFTSLEGVQEFVDGVNKDVIELGDTETIIEGINDALEAQNMVQLLSALEASFDRVNPDNIDDYEVALDGADPGDDATSLTTLTGVQDAIDGVNLTAATNLVAAAQAADADRDDYNAALEAVSFVAPDEEDVTTKADFETTLKEVDRVLRVFEASTVAQLSVAYNNLVSLVDDEGIIGDAPFFDEARSFYLTKLETAGLARTSSAVEAQIVAGNAEAQLDAVTTLDGLAADASTSTVLSALEGLAAVTEDTVFDFADVATDDDTVADYRDAILAITTYGAGDNAEAPTLASVTNDIADVVGAVDLVNNPAAGTILADIDDLATAAGTETAGTAGTAAQFYDGVNAVQGLSDLFERFNVVEDYQAAYFTNVDAFAGAITNEGDAVNTVEELKAASTATEARAALTTLALNTYASGVSETVNYINLTSTQKLELAESILDVDFSGDTAEEVAVAIFDDATPAAAGYVSDYVGLLDGVNAADTIAEMQSALAAIGYDAFDDLTAQRQVEVSESFLAEFPMNDADTPARIDYKSLASIKADVDVAIDATN
ncbi:S-layer homology domain-containing protein [Aquibacillus salsiterrae]|uniref:S-layer homology domain-containing protein n=1 Tax=Aquibacillus salsiterrae TaxID=2950439 RepID=A0A9X4AEC3_9BACI|nr:S-layer homology domain-containing protein [Aquibacillus salsiterrae]MDC3416692.1 S-layer homology domain-containing protein [Aquibacillus salsiterrae]